MNERYRVVNERGHVVVYGLYTQQSAIDAASSLSAQTGASYSIELYMPAINDWWSAETEVTR
jgi:hypothetical protein